MTAYEFLNWTPSAEAYMKATEKRYSDAPLLRTKIELAFKSDPRKFDDYKESKNLFIDVTMSGTIDEAICYMERLMVDAVAYGIETKNKDWQTKFLAAYDILVSLCGTKRNGRITI